MPGAMIGVIDAVKTCVTLFDVVSTARNADRDLEDLLAQLQWHRIRFYLWLVETGLADILATQAHFQADSLPSTPDANLLAMLPCRLRLPVVLAHIERTINNMNLRLQATEHIVERYCGTGTPAGVQNWSEWLANIRCRDAGGEMCALDSPSSQGSLPTSPSLTQVAETRKLAIWDKVRWVTGDLKELRYLVETVRQYNSELAGILNGPRVYGVEGPADRELTASSDSAGKIAS